MRLFSDVVYGQLIKSVSLILSTQTDGVKGVKSVNINCETLFVKRAIIGRRIMVGQSDVRFLDAFVVDGIMANTLLLFSIDLDFFPV